MFEKINPVFLFFQYELRNPIGDQLIAMHLQPFLPAQWFCFVASEGHGGLRLFPDDSAGRQWLNDEAVGGDVDGLEAGVLREMPTGGKSMRFFVGVLAGGFAIVPVDAPGGEVVVPGFTAAGDGLNADGLAKMIDEVGPGHANLDSGLVGFRSAGTAGQEEQAKSGEEDEDGFHGAMNVQEW